MTKFKAAIAKRNLVKWIAPEALKGVEPKRPKILGTLEPRAKV